MRWCKVKEIKMNPEEKMRFSRQIKLAEIGIEGQEKIRNAKILVIGAGGLGCPILLYLASSGVGTIGILDFDTVELHNLHRQILYSDEDIGKAKTLVAFEKLNLQFPTTQFIALNERLNKTNAEKLIQSFDFIVDGSDNFPTRYLVNDTCVQLNKPLIYGSILDFEGQLAVFNYKGSKNLRNLFPEPPDPKDTPGCEENGVLATLPAIIGTMMAQETLKVIVEQNVMTNRLILFNTSEWNLKTLHF